LRFEIGAIARIENRDFAIARSAGPIACGAASLAVTNP